MIPMLGREGGASASHATAFRAELAADLTGTRPRRLLTCVSAFSSPATCAAGERRYSPDAVIFPRTDPSVRCRYRRRVTDLPLSGRIVQLLVIARRFRCDAVLCGRQIFTERFAEGVLAPSARRTARLGLVRFDEAANKWPPSKMGIALRVSFGDWRTDEPLEDRAVRRALHRVVGWDRSGEARNEVRPPPRLKADRLS
jgi:hypothetical protein